VSILLEALKKSESQRQLGTTPGIHSPVELPSTDEDSGKQWIPLSLLALSALAIAWFGWHQYREPPPQTVSVQQAPSAALESEQTSMPEGESMEPGRTPVESFQEEGKEPETEGKMAAVEPPDTDARKQNLNRSFSEYKAPSDQPVPDNNPADLPPADKRTAASVALVKPPSQSAAKAVNRAPPQKKPTPAEQHTLEPISFWAIPQALRDGMPEIRITGLVYAQTPEDRFVLINGQSLKEKEEVAPGILIDEIRRDGVVFSYRKYRFLVKS